MAITSLAKLKKRMDSIENLADIMHAMELIASSKLPYAKQRAEHSSHYFREVYVSLQDVMESDAYMDNPYMARREIRRTCLLVIGGDRGFAGGYNANVFREAEALAKDREVIIYPVGRKTREYFAARGVPLRDGACPALADMGVRACKELSLRLDRDYRKGLWDELMVVYTGFASAVTQTPAHIRVLPLRKPNRPARGGTRILYEPGSDDIFDHLIPQLVFGILYGAVSESYASELAARKLAMNTAKQNADEILEKTELAYSRLRQEGITREISEIIAAAGTEEGLF